VGQLQGLQQNNQGLQQNVQALQQNVQGLQQKLEALRTLERSLSERAEPVPRKR
jgi:prefoldin subunit 5